MSDESGLLNFRDVADLLGGKDFPLRAGFLLRFGVLRWPGPERLARILVGPEPLIIDLRSAKERARVPALQDVLKHDVLQYVSDIKDNAPHLFFDEATSTETAIIAYFTARYVEMTTDENYDRLFGDVFDLLSSTSGPVLIHCSAGKDRTGLLVALILSAIGASYTEIERDYLASNDSPGIEASVHDAMARLQSTLPEKRRNLVAATLARADARYLHAAFAALHRRHGSLDAYFSHIGLTNSRRMALRLRFLDL